MNAIDPGLVRLFERRLVQMQHPVAACDASALASVGASGSPLLASGVRYAVELAGVRCVYGIYDLGDEAGRAQRFAPLNEACLTLLDAGRLLVAHRNAFQTADGMHQTLSVMLAPAEVGAELQATLDAAMARFMTVFWTGVSFVERGDEAPGHAGGA